MNENDRTTRELLLEAVISARVELNRADRGPDLARASSRLEAAQKRLREFLENPATKGARGTP